MNKIKEVKHNCYQFDPDLITGTIDPGQPLPLENYFKNTVVPANESIPDLYEFMHAMARQIAYGQILAEGMLAESVLETLNENAGDVERELIVRGKELIYRALGTRQIEGLYTTNIDAIRAIVEKAGQEEEDSGPSGREIN
jgi:hypothetical protein